MTKPDDPGALAPAAKPEKVSSSAHLVAGTKDPDLRRRLVSQLAQTMMTRGKASAEDQEKLLRAALAAINGLAPQDEAEGMLSVQMIATHHAAVECLRTALFDPNSRDRNLVHAGKLLNIYIRQLQTIDRRRGLGRQQVNVGTVNVESGAQAIVGNVASEARETQ